MINNTLVSIIVPTYKRPGFLKKTLQSLIQQTYQNLEIIVVNNFPELPLNNIINNLNDPRIKLYQEQKKGSSQARNKGLKEATGNYICFCDDDDLYLPEKIEKQVQFMINNPRLNFSYHNYYFQKNGKRILSYPTVKPTTAPEFLATNYLAAPIHTLMIQKDCLKKIKFDTNLKGSEGADFIMKLAVKFDFKFFNEPLVIYQLHDKNKKKKKGPDYFIADHYVNAKHIKSLLTVGELEPKTQKRLKLKLHYHQGLIDFYKFKLGPARKDFLNFISQKPVCFWPYFYFFTSLLGKNLIKRQLIPNIAQFEYYFFKLKTLNPFKSKSNIF